MTKGPTGWETARLADVAEVRLGRQRSPKRATGDRMRPYLRAANVTWQGLNLTDVKQMDFTVLESATYELQSGDLLLAEASGSPGEVGKPARYSGQLDGCCFQNTLLRVRVPDGLRPDFYEHFFREQALNGRFAAGSRGVGIHHLGATAAI
jgi:type I restriction enzyme S subunit